MKSMKKAQLVTMVITVAILAAAGSGIYFLCGERSDRKSPAGEETAYVPGEDSAGEAVTTPVEGKDEENKAEGSSGGEGVETMSVNAALFTQIPLK